MQAFRTFRSSLRKPTPTR